MARATIVLPFFAHLKRASVTQGFVTQGFHVYLYFPKCPRGSHLCRQALVDGLHNNGIKNKSILIAAKPLGFHCWAN